jgi:putative transposon-encoded protein
MFTEDNTEGFTKEQLDVMNEALTEALKGFEYGTPGYFEEEKRESELITKKMEWVISEFNNPMIHNFNIKGIEAVEKTVKSGSGHSARINVPPSWQGKRVMVVRLE